MTTDLFKLVAMGANTAAKTVHQRHWRHITTAICWRDALELLLGSGPAGQKRSEEGRDSNTCIAPTWNLCRRPTTRCS